MIFVGIDPGLSGALAVVEADGQLVQVRDTPTLHVGTKREYDRADIKRILDALVSPFVVVRGQRLPGSLRPDDAMPRDPPHDRQDLEKRLIACVERVHAMPGQGVVSMWRMGQGFELWCMAFTMLDIPWETVTPQRWKGVMLDGMPKGKDASRYRAQQLWPKQAEFFSRKKDDGRAEAGLIAEYLRRQWGTIKYPKGGSFDE